MKRLKSERSAQWCIFWLHQETSNGGRQPPPLIPVNLTLVSSRGCAVRVTAPNPGQIHLLWLHVLFSKAKCMLKIFFLFFYFWLDCFCWVVTNNHSSAFVSSFTASIHLLSWLQVSTSASFSSRLSLLCSFRPEESGLLLLYSFNHVMWSVPYMHIWVIIVPLQEKSSTFESTQPRSLPPDSSCLLNRQCPWPDLCFAKSIYHPSAHCVMPVEVCRLKHCVDKNRQRAEQHVRTLTGAEILHILHQLSCLSLRKKQFGPNWCKTTSSCAVCWFQTDVTCENRWNEARNLSNSRFICTLQSSCSTCGSSSVSFSNVCLFQPEKRGLVSSCGVELVELKPSEGSFLQWSVMWWLASVLSKWRNFIWTLSTPNTI